MNPDSDEMVKVAVIGGAGSGTGDGGAPLKSGIAVTADSQPDVAITVVGPVRAILIRSTYVFLVSINGLLAAGATTKLLPAADFLSLLKTCAELSVGVVGVSVLKDLITIFGRLEAKYPLASGSI